MSHCVAEENEDPRFKFLVISPKQHYAPRIETNIKAPDVLFSIIGYKVCYLHNASLHRKSARHLITLGTRAVSTGRPARSGAHLQALFCICPQPESRKPVPPNRLGLSPAELATWKKKRGSIKPTKKQRFPLTQSQVPAALSPSNNS